MYAVIETGGKQYKVRSGEVVRIEKLPVEAGSTVKLEKVLLIQGDKGITVGTPTIPGASVMGEVVSQGRGRKLVIFKKKRRKNYRRTRGHRQSYTQVKVTQIESGSASASF